MTAKIISKLSKVLLSGALVVTFYCKWKGFLPCADTGSIITCYLTAYGIVAGTIDMNIMLDKLIHKNKTEESK